ncbi:MAG TPA: S46 family peptidase [Bdellovibrio sp.]|uniref:S46 family peptidase n=1 Tax=Bdellovibrio sp. TaxID=28201 RepID=UPI002F02319D
MNLRLMLLVSSFLFAANHALADEGMWTLNNFPTKTVEEKYKFKATGPWLDHVRLSSARLAGGCSASFVSSNGLVMTNHHCAHSCIEQLSTAKKDFVESGFYAKTQADEVRCPEIEVNKLVEITDVTARIQRKVKGLQGKEYNEALKAEMSTLEKECSQGNDQLRCDTVTLYHGGQYNLYKYKRYQDVRLVFAPEFAIAFFGGDPDNFMFPRYDFDISFLRVYENNQPLKTQDYFKWSPAGAHENELTFVTGHPGSTSRLLTVSELEYIRDVRAPEYLMYLSELRGILTEFQTKGAEQKRIANSQLFGVENSLKGLKGRFFTLTDKKFFAKKVADENAFRAKVNGNPTWKKAYGTAWDEMALAEHDLKNIHTQLQWKEDSWYGSRLFGIAKTLVRAASELPKPNEKRYREFADSALPQMKQRLLSTAPIYDDLEITNLTFNLTKMREQLTADDPFVRKVLGNKSPAELATELVKNTHLKDIKVREELLNGGQKAIEASKDPLIKLLVALDSEARAIRQKFEDDIEPRLRRASEKVAQAQFAVFGSKTYPDATFTLRISYGQMKGYSENGKWVKPYTTIGGAYERATGSDPFALPESWLKAKESVNKETDLNFCTTNDIIGGNSGSPVINKEAEIVGLIFDGNIQSLGGDYGYDGTVNRAVAVHSASVLELLQKVYKAERIVQDIKGTTP